MASAHPFRGFFAAPAPARSTESNQLRRLGRSALAGLLLAALSGFVSLLLAIVALLVASAAGAGQPDMRIAYYFVAAPVALFMLPVGFVGNLLLEDRTSRSR